MDYKTIICASWCGTGKTFICENTDIKSKLDEILNDELEDLFNF